MTKERESVITIISRRGRPEANRGKEKKMKYIKIDEIKSIVDWTDDALCLKHVKDFGGKKIGFNKALNVSVFKLKDGTEVATNWRGEIITCLA